jgi:membrane fusion protein (multidrug efflux system)
MTDIEAHPTTNRLSAYSQGRLDEPDMDEIEQHLSSCDSCCRWIREQPEDSLVAKLRDRGAATVVKHESSAGPTPGLQVPSSFILGADVKATVHQVQPAVAGLPGDLIEHPRYRVVAALGSGGMGTVYRAEHRLMDRPVALKVIRGDLLGNSALVERFRREVRSAARLASHANIVAAYDAEQAGETHMLVMEFVEGTDLARLVDRRGPLPTGEACEYARQAAMGLQHAFDDEMVHRDIKPQNLMRTTRGQIKILDFGLARFASEVGSHAGVTAEGMVLGSADYIAPEQIEDPHAADIRADIYSLGCTLYFLLAGQPAFPDRSLIQKLIAHREKTPRPIRDIRGDVSPELAHVVERMMAKDPAERFQTPAEVARALAPFAETQTAATGVDAPALAGPRALPATSSSFDSMVGEQKPSGPLATRPGSPPRRRWVRIAAVVALLPIVALSLALILYQLMIIRTPTGELVIESEAPDIEVIVRQGGQQVTIVDPKTSNRIELKAGRYDLQLAGGGPGLQLSTDTFTLNRGEKTVVTVRRQAPAPAAAAKPGPQTRHEEQKIVTTMPRATDVTITQQYVCQIRSPRPIDVRAPENGYLKEISVKVGQEVKKGDSMFKIVPARSQAKLDAEKAEAEIAQLEFGNVEKLAKQAVVSQNELKLFQAKLAKAQAKVRQAEAELALTKVGAPFDGLVDRLHQQPGSLIKEGDILTTLSDRSVMWVYFNVPEKQYLEYKAAQKQREKEDTFELVLANREKFPHPGKFGGIEAQFNNQTGNIPFRADFPNPDGLLRDGQTGTILIHRQLHDAIVIPQRATYEILDKRYVYVVDNDQVAHRREILVQHEIDDIFVIEKGVGVGDLIVLEGIRQVRDGEKVEYYEVRHPEHVMGGQENQAGASRAVKTISPRTRAILDTLEQTIPVNFSDEIPLDDVLTYIKWATFKGEKPTDPGLPIYVDPLVERARQSKVRMAVNDVPLRLTLSLLLDQVGLAYLVKDDVLIISSPQGIDQERNETWSPAADETPRTRRVLAELEEPIPMSFANRPPLDNMLTYIRQATTNISHDGIPIVSDPRGLQEAGCSLTSTVSINLDGVPLKTTLRLMLKQLGLTYIVKDGGVIISSIEGVRRWKRRPGLEQPSKVEPGKTQ